MTRGDVNPVSHVGGLAHATRDGLKYRCTRAFVHQYGITRRMCAPRIRANAHIFALVHHTRNEDVYDRACIYIALMFGS